MDNISKKIIENYNYYDEDSRLKSPYGILEEEHTKRLISRHLDSVPIEIYDIGAGTGHYSVWLADLGHHVYFSDIVPKHVEVFKNRVGISENILSIDIEDARQLSYNDNVADLIILNGPLYHLTEREDRLKVLREAKRILKRNGRLLGFSISRFAGLNYALSSNEIFNDNYFEMVVKEIKSGVRDNNALKNKTFNTAYFHLLEEIESEFIESGLVIENSFGVGLSWSASDLPQLVNDITKKERLLKAMELIEKYPMQCSKILTVGIKY